MKWKPPTPVSHAAVCVCVGSGVHSGQFGIRTRAVLAPAKIDSTNWGRRVGLKEIYRVTFAQCFLFFLEEGGGWWGEFSAPLVHGRTIR